MRNSRAGLTLIEVMIAVSMVSLLSVGMLLALRIGLNAMTRSEAKLMENRRIAGAQRILEQEVAGFVPVRALYGTQGGQQRIPFFQGEAQAMRFVSTYSLNGAGRGVPQILELFVAPGDQGRGVRLLVNELPYTGPVTAGSLTHGYLQDPVSGVLVPQFAPIQARPQSFILADKLAGCRFQYLEPHAPPELAIWRDHWVLPRWPLAVRIEMSSLDHTPDHLSFVPVTIPVRVQRDPTREYADDFQ